MSQLRRAISAVNYDETKTYDTSGRVSQITYPSGFAIEHRQRNGYLFGPRDASGNFLYWTGNVAHSPSTSA